MTADVRDKLVAEFQAAEAEIKRLRAEKAARKDAADGEVSEEERAERKAISSALNKARTRLEDVQAALERFDKGGGQEHAVVVQGNCAIGTIAVKIAPGTSHEDRQRLIEDALDEPLNAAAEELGVVLSAAPVKFVRERPGRDAEGRTVLDVEGIAEGDRLVPAVRQGRRRS